MFDLIARHRSARPCASRFVAVLALVCAYACMGIAGCGSSSIAKIGTIAISGATVSNGVTSMLVSKTATVSMTGVNDPRNLGIDWSVTCSGSPTTGSTTGGACGTFYPAHTASGASTTFTAPSLVPINSTVTMTAALTADASQTASLTLTVTSVGITVAINTSTTSLGTGSSGYYSATVTNDSDGAGVTWSASCGSSDCGSFSSTTTLSGVSTTYTAPAGVPSGGTVIITATSVADTTRSASVTITITQGSTTQPISVSITPQTFYVETSGVTAAREATLTATVANDSTNKGVSWKLGCTGCGQLQSSQTASGASNLYLGPTSVPTGGTVTITATSIADSTKFATAVATVTSSTLTVVSMSAAPSASMTVDSTATLAATVTNESNPAQGVNWTATCGSAGACGTFSAAHTASGGTTIYTAPSSIPSGSTVTITASSPVSPSNAASATTTITAAPPSVAITQEPPSSMTATAETSVIATVTNDSTASGVNWTVSCNQTTDGACGSITPYLTASNAVATYTAPPATTTGTTVTIKATSVANSSQSANSTSIAIIPSTTISVGFLPSAPTQIPTDGTVNFNAFVSNDSTSGGVDWKVCSSGCGFFTTTPAIAAVAATSTTPYQPAVPAVTATTVSGWPSGLRLPYTAPSDVPSSGVVAIQIAAHASSSVTNSTAVTITNAAGGPVLHGKVLAASEAVAGASVSLYVAGSSGYGSASQLLSAAGEDSTIQTDANGAFTIPSGYGCPSSTSQIYLVATGGTVGSNTSANSTLAMMTALGSCGALSSTSIVINEVTTVASVWPLAPFAANEPLTGNINYLHIGSSSSNSTGIANAFATVNNLVDITTGKARYFVPSGNASVPYVTINTLADIVNACTSTTGGSEGDGSECGDLLTDADPLFYDATIYNSTSPTNTLRAAFNIAQHPDAGFQYNLGSRKTFFAFASLASPFQPMLSAAPNDWSLSLNFTGGGGITSASSASYFAIDSSGDLWITDSNAGTVAEWSNTGAVMSTSSGYSADGGPIAIDASGNIWTSGDSRLHELTSLGKTAAGSPYVGVSGGGNDMAFDASGYLWITTGTGVAKFDSVGEESRHRMATRSAAYPIRRK